MTVLVDDHLYFSADYNKKLDENGTYTRDIPLLNLYEDHYLFVYGTLKRGCSGSSIILSNRKNRFCGIGVTVDNSFDLLINNHALPVVIENTNKERLLKVKGELWLIDVETLIKIDNMESNGFIYERELRQIIVGKESVLAWMYLGIPKFWRNKELHDSPKFPTNNAASVPVAERTNKHYVHYYNEGFAHKITNKKEAD